MQVLKESIENAGHIHWFNNGSNQLTKNNNLKSSGNFSTVFFTSTPYLSKQDFELIDSVSTSALASQIERDGSSYDFSGTMLITNLTLGSKTPILKKKI